ncbi:MAG: alpha/beta hydrolase [Gammaproteobacteria bacterium]
MLKIICYLLLAYCVLVTGLYLAQRHIVFQPDTRKPDRGTWQAYSMYEVTLRTSDNLKLLSWYKPARNNLPTIIYLHGNASHIGPRFRAMQPFLLAGYGLLLVEYRGYGGNSGTPTEAGLYHDARAAFAFLKQQYVPASCQVLWGESLGSGVAMQMAIEFPSAALILQSPYTNLVEVGQYHYPWLPVKWLLKDRFDSFSKVAHVNVPIFWLHGGADNVVPAELGKRLFEALPEPKQGLLVRQAGHHDIHNYAFKPIHDFLTQQVKCHTDNIN